ncbi:SIR2 family histone deacetylase [Coniosporium apollinis CBS 100218]|uniref:SIR2 family histone deacetylase n=1 Tax=Coniosporium apollinis (strain CBS 100218) TaxID=1168221 RepID=R7Z241_CONA1|nr:SIR2 family histone deacetylase [Coniosporium apollinis CBS 100218]EON68153.1 SIR2 family histone deacetylase [Coniosporium apollinis CBS 100218]
MDLATPEAFRADPGLVWQFYSYRRHMALKAQPNRAHLALAELAKRKEGFMTLSQNVDGLSQRAGHPREKLQLLHGSLFDVKCTNFWCDFAEENNFADPIVPALEIPVDEPDPTSSEARQAVSDALRAKKKELDISDARVQLPELRYQDLPQCPKCKEGLLRPGVVWFGEMLPEKTISTIDDWLTASKKIDLIMVIGTSARVYPAAAYVDRARAKGARVAVINTERTDAPSSGLRKDDWFFQGDAGQVVPEILKSVVGEISAPTEKL